MKSHKNSHLIAAPDTERLLTPIELAECLSVSVKTVYHWVHCRKIPFIRVGKHLRFHRADVILRFKELTGGDSNPCPIPRPLVTSPCFRSLKNR